MTQQQPIESARLTIQVNSAESTWQEFVLICMEHGLAHVRESTYETSARTLDIDGIEGLQRSLLSEDHTDETFLAMDKERSIATFGYLSRYGSLTLRAAALSSVAAQREMERLKEQYPATPTVLAEQRVPVHFWTMTQNGPKSIRRVIDVQRWDEVHDNYAAETRQALDDLMQGKPEGGKIILWQGLPGTGKTHALRTLGWEWRDRFDIHYVVDPEIMFGEQSSYLLHVALGAGDEEGSEMVSSHGGSGHSAPTKPRWRLMVLEDAGEMLGLDAKEKVGQSLSRLLNVTDGLIGQGVNLMVLITTNDELQELHPALSRYGRCASVIEFSPLSIQECIAWQERRMEAHIDVKQPLPVSDLYALANGLTGAKRKRSKGMGFTKAAG